MCDSAKVGVGERCAMLAEMMATAALAASCLQRCMHFNKMLCQF